VGIGEIALDVDQRVRVILVGTFMEWVEEPAVPFEPVRSQAAQLSPRCVRPREPGCVTGVGLMAKRHGRTVVQMPRGAPQRQASANGMSAACLCATDIAR
jgi:hypothetical protein